MEILAESTAKAIIHCAAEKIDITDWLFTLKDQEYQSCSASHTAAGTSVSQDGKRMSVNVERIAGNLFVQHYIEEVGARNHCRVNSVSDSISDLGITKLGITWEIKIVSLSADSCVFENKVLVTSTPEFLALLEAAGITNLEMVKAQMLQNVVAHNNEETPLFAADIHNKVLAGKWH
jgi:hypothetical protein